MLLRGWLQPNVFAGFRLNRRWRKGCRAMANLRFASKAKLFPLLGVYVRGELRVFSKLMNPLRGHKSARSHQQSQIIFSAEDL